MITNKVIDKISNYKKKAPEEKTDIKSLIKNSIQTLIIR